MLSIDRLRQHQKDAVNRSIENDFSSGVHFHATGTGKSWVSFYILAYFFNMYKESKITFKNNPDPLIVFWICERKSILKEQFDKAILTDRGFYDFLKSSFHVLRLNHGYQQ